MNYCAMLAKRTISPGGTAYLSMFTVCNFEIYKKIGLQLMSARFIDSQNVSVLHLDDGLLIF